MASRGVQHLAGYSDVTSGVAGLPLHVVSPIVLCVFSTFRALLPV